MRCYFGVLIVLLVAEINDCECTNLNGSSTDLHMNNSLARKNKTVDLLLCV
jgi:hypothetical protein